MISINEFTKRAGKFAQDNSPAILTAIGIAGTLTTAFLSGVATLKAAKLIQDHNEKQDVHDLWMPSKDAFRLCWRLYVPAGTSLALTVTAIILAHRIGHRRAAAMASAYLLAERALDEYREKVLEKIGANKEREIRDEIAQGRVAQHPVGTAQVVVAAGGDVLCFETHTGRYFRSDIETLKKAQNTLNYRVINDNYASLTDFYGLIGLTKTDISDELGWNTSKLMELEFSATIAETGVPCIAITYVAMPIRDYYKFG